MSLSSPCISCHVACVFKSVPTSRSNFKSVPTSHKQNGVKPMQQPETHQHLAVVQTCQQHVAGAPKPHNARNTTLATNPPVMYLLDLLAMTNPTPLLSTPAFHVNRNSLSVLAANAYKNIPATLHQHIKDRADLEDIMVHFTNAAATTLQRSIPPYYTGGQACTCYTQLMFLALLM